VLFETLFVFAAEFALERFDLTSNGIEHAGAGFANEWTIGGRIEKTLEKGMRRIFGGIDVGFAARAAIVGQILELRAFIGTSKTGYRGFEGFVGAWRERLVILGRDLIDARILHRGNDGIANVVDFEVGTSGTNGAHAGMMRMEGGFDGQSTDDADVIFEGQKGSEGIVGGNVPIRTDGLRRPSWQVNAIAEKPKAKTSRDFIAGGKGIAIAVEHEIEERQTDGNGRTGEHAAQKKTSGRLNLRFRFHGCTSFVTAGLARRYPSFVTRAKTSCLKE